jgi:hypothetical protein
MKHREATGSTTDFRVASVMLSLSHAVKALLKNPVKEECK